MAILSGVKALKQSVGMIERGIREGMSGRSIMKSLREGGFSFRTEKFYKVHRAVKGWTNQWDKMKYVNKDKKLGERFFADALGFQSQTYKWRVSITFWSPQKETWVEFFTDVVSDTNMILDDVFGYATKGAFAQIAHYQVKWGSMRLYQATKESNADFWATI